MKLNEDILEAKRKITNAINAYGFSPDHNYYNYLYSQGHGKKCVFFDFGQNKGIVAFHNEKKRIWRIINGIFAPKQERLEILQEFLEWAHSEKNSKVFVEFQEDFKAEVFSKLKVSYRMNVSYILYWPVYDLDNLDEKLAGKEWKKLRNIRNRFLTGHKFEIKNPRRVDKEELKSVLVSWTKKRYPRDRVNFEYYANIINNKFEGFDVLRAISLDGKVCAFSGGWNVPNSSHFYYAIGIFNYNHKYLGDFVNLDDLLHIKKEGHRIVDLGGSDKSTIMFKKKFNPVSIYKTYFFSISPKKDSIYRKI